MGGEEDRGGIPHVEGEEERGEEGRSGCREGGGRGADQVGVAALLEAPPPHYPQCRRLSLVINSINSITTHTHTYPPLSPPSTSLSLESLSSL